MARNHRGEIEARTEEEASANRRRRRLDGREEETEALFRDRRRIIAATKGKADTCDSRRRRHLRVNKR